MSRMVLAAMTHWASSGLGHASTVRSGRGGVSDAAVSAECGGQLVVGGRELPQRLGGGVRVPVDEVVLEAADQPGLPGSDGGGFVGELFAPDMLHLNRAGYALWRQEISAHLGPLADPSGTVAPTPALAVADAPRGAR